MIESDMAEISPMDFGPNNGGFGVDLGVGVIDRLEKFSEDLNRELKGSYREFVIMVAGGSLEGAIGVEKKLNCGMQIARDFGNYVEESLGSREKGVVDKEKINPKLGWLDDMFREKFG